MNAAEAHVGPRPAARCWVCSSDDTAPWKPGNLPTRLESSDLQITDARYGVTLPLRRCAACGFVFVDDPDDLERLGDLYDALEDPEYEGGAEPRTLQMQWLLDVGTRSRPGVTSVLDIGAGSGLLIDQAAARGFETAGIEPSRALVERGHERGVRGLVQGRLPHPDLGDRRFDLVFLVDVIEHVADPVALLRDCRNALADDGRLVVVTPDLGSVAARVLGHRWWHLRVAHVGYFTRDTLTRAARAAGLEPASWTRARWFFRVSYLAERAARYLPVAGLNRWAARLGILRRAYDLVVPINLHDSWVVVLRPAR